MPENRPRLAACLLLVCLGGCAPDGSTALGPPAARVARATDLGRLSPSVELDFVVSLSLRDPEGVHRLLSERPRIGGEPLAPHQFAARFAPSSEEYQRVVAWLRGNGLTITRTTDGRTTISAHGTAAAVEQAFACEMHQYQLDGEKFAAASTPLRLGPELVGSISGVVGLSGSPNWKTHYRRAQPYAGTMPLAASDLQALYHVNGLTSPGQGETVAILGFGPPADPIRDVAKYYHAAYGSTTNPMYDQVFVGGANREPPSQVGEIENAIDPEMVLAMAPGAHVVHVFSANSSTGLLTDALAYIVDQVPMAHAVSVSSGLCERLSMPEMPVTETLLQQAQAQGQQFFISSGDDGTDGCRDGSGNKHISQSYPATSPYAVAVGGTMIVNGVEVAWNENSPSNGAAAGGGGPSEAFAKPAYQVGLTPDDGARDVPDVSAYSAVSPGVSVDVANVAIPVGGTSVAAPLWAGIWADLDQAKGGKGITDGLHKLYLVGKTNSFTDITMGDNGGPGDSGTGYLAAPGYDLATGWGVANVPNLISNIQP